MTFFVYILFSKKLDRHYIGTTDDVEERFDEHNTASYPDTFSIKGIPWELFLIIEGLTSVQAYAIERHIKKMKSVKYIVNLKLYPEMVEKLKKRYS